MPTSETAAQAAIRQAVGGENDGPSRQLGRFVKSVAENDDTGMNIRVIWRRDRYLRASDHISFLSQGYPAGRFTEPRENFNHEHQDVRVENGVQFGDLTEFCDFDYIARVAKVNAATLWSLAQAPGTRRASGIAHPQLTNLTTLAGPQPRAGPGRVRGGVAGDDRAGVDARHRRRQRDDRNHRSVQGQRLLRRTRGRLGRASTARSPPLCPCPEADRHTLSTVDRREAPDRAGRGPRRCPGRARSVVLAQPVPAAQRRLA